MWIIVILQTESPWHITLLMPMFSIVQFPLLVFALSLAVHLADTEADTVLQDCILYPQKSPQSRESLSHRHGKK